MRTSKNNPAQVDIELENSENEFIALSGNNNPGKIGISMRGCIQVQLVMS